MSKIRPSTQLAQDGASTNYVLTWDGTKWTGQAATGGMTDPTTTKGDLIVHGTSTTRLAVGSDGQGLVADSTQTNGVKWAGDTAWTAPTLTSPWVNAGVTGHPNAGYRKDSAGIVHLTGLVQGGSQFSTIFTLPTGYRPATKNQYLCLGSSVTAVGIEVDPDGSVIWLSNANLPVDLDSIHFVAS